MRIERAPIPATKQEKGPSKITIDRLRNTDVPIYVNGINFSPAFPKDPLESIKIGERLLKQQWFIDFMNQNPEFSSYVSIGNPDDGTLFSLMEHLSSWYVDYKHANNYQDPPWFANLSSSERNYLSSRFVWDDGDQSHDRIHFLPLKYAGLVNGYFIEWEKWPMFSDVEQTFDLRRLEGIKQLSMSRGITLSNGLPEMVEGFHFNRHSHSVDVLAIATLLGTNLGLSPEDLKLVQIAALSHDYRTPAGGDTTKKTDPEAFDEDKHYKDIFNTSEWETFAAKYEINKEQQEKLYQTVLGKGVLGKILDLSDKIAYVSRDPDRYINYEIRNVEYGEGTKGLERIKTILEGDSFPGGFWESAELEGENVVINDSRRLATFLKLRAVLWKHLYENFNGGFSVAIFAENLIKYLKNSSELTNEWLLENRDSDLEDKLAEFCGLDHFPRLAMSLKHKKKSFSDLEEAKKFAQKYNDRLGQIAVVDEFSIASNPSVSKFVVRKNEQILPFDQAYPGDADEIKQAMNFPYTVNVYIVSLSELGIPESNWGRIKEVFRI